MALYEVICTATPVNISALLGVPDDVAWKIRGRNLGQYSVYRAVSENAPTDLSGAVWQYNPGEDFNLNIYAGAALGNTWLMSAGDSVRVVIEDSLP